MVIELKKKRVKKKYVFFFKKKDEVECRSSTLGQVHQGLVTKLKKNKKEKHMDYMLFSM